MCLQTSSLHNLVMVRNCMDGCFKFDLPWAFYLDSCTLLCQSNECLCFFFWTAYWWSLHCPWARLFCFWGLPFFLSMDCFEPLSLSTPFFLWTLFQWIYIIWHHGFTAVQAPYGPSSTLTCECDVFCCDLDFFPAHQGFWCELSLRILELFWRCFQWTTSLSPLYALLLLSLLLDDSCWWHCLEILSSPGGFWVFLQWSLRAHLPFQGLRTSPEAHFHAPQALASHIAG